MPAPDPQASWQPVLATVTRCRRTYATWFVNETIPDELGTYSQAEFLIIFSYTVNGRTYRGGYTAGSPHLPGETLEITFDPSHPQNHTGSDPTRTFAARLLLGAIALAIVVLLLYFFPDTNW